ncbi:MAG: hypothetical protein OXU79_14095 [Gemmatimonadota bacterium]|nr:hypothetical protein [Gemmatimonadota bacterium]
MYRFLVAAVILGLFAPASARAQKVGDTVPTFSLTGLDDKTYAPVDYVGHVFVLYYLGHN